MRQRTIPPQEEYLRSFTGVHRARDDSSYLCEQCDEPIQCNQEYERKVFRVIPNNRRKKSYLLTRRYHTICLRDM
jgi:hypothetical protein